METSILDKQQFLLFAFVGHKLDISQGQNDDVQIAALHQSICGQCGVVHQIDVQQDDGATVKFWFAHRQDGHWLHFEFWQICCGSSVIL